MRLFRRIEFAAMLLLLVAAVAMPLRQRETTARARALACAVLTSNRTAAFDLLSSGVDPNLMVACRTYPFRTSRVGYGSLLLLARERRDTAMAHLLLTYGASYRWEPPIRSLIPYTPLDRPTSVERPTAWGPVLGQVTQHFEKNSHPQRIDLVAEERSHWSTMLFPALLMLTGVVRMFRIGVPGAEPSRRQLVYTWGAGLLLLGCSVVGVITWLTS